MRAAEVKKLKVGDLVRIRSGYALADQGPECDQNVVVARVVSFDARESWGRAEMTVPGDGDGKAVVIERVRVLRPGSTEFTPSPAPTRVVMNRDLLCPWDDQTEAQWLATVTQQLAHRDEAMQRRMEEKRRAAEDYRQKLTQLTALLDGPELDDDAATALHRLKNKVPVDPADAVALALAAVEASRR